MEEDVTQHQAHIFRVLSQDLLNQLRISVNVTERFANT